MIAFTAVVAVILASSTIVYDRLCVIDAVRNARAHTETLLDTLQQAMDAMVDQETGLRGFLSRRQQEVPGAVPCGCGEFEYCNRESRKIFTKDPLGSARIESGN